VDFSHYSDAPVQIAVDLVNTLDVLSDEDRLAQPGDVADFLTAHDEGEWCRPGWRAQESDLHEVRALRARLREVFEAEDDAAAAVAINSILADVDAVPRLSVHAGADPHMHFEPLDGSPARWLGAVTAMGLSVALIEGGFDRFGICGSTSCDDVFVDTSRNRSRRHCSDTCTTRENVAAYRARQRSADGG
jgi:predicted RNA-binding Zn ribbon-like protein